MSPKSGNVLYGRQEFEGPPSPTIVSNLDTQQKSRKKPGIPEEAPMLKKTSSCSSDSESETSLEPKALNEIITPVSDKPVDYKANILTDNYVNVPSTIFNSKKLSPNTSKDAFSNPGYVTLGIINENEK